MHFLKTLFAFGCISMLQYEAQAQTPALDTAFCNEPVTGRPAGNRTLMANHMVTDAAGNVYVIGNFTGTDVPFAAFGAAPKLSSNAAAIQNVFVAKYDNNGAVEWAFPIKSGATTNGDNGISIALDHDNNIYVAGVFSGTDSVDFNPDPAERAMLKVNGAAGNKDIFLAKYNNSGVYQWALNIGAQNALDVVRAIATDAAGNVVITGSFRTDAASPTVNFDPINNNPSALLSSATNASHAFVAKYSTQGNYLWAFNIGSTQTNGTVGTGIAATASGDIFVTGTFHGVNVELNPLDSTDPRPLTASGNGSQAGSSTGLFIARYNNDGINQWAIPVKSNNNGTTFSNPDNNLAIDGDENVYINGNMKGSVVYFDVANNTASLTINYSGIYLAKYNGAGIYQWKKRAIAQSSGPLITSTAFTIDGGGNAYVTGNFGNGAIGFAVDDGPTLNLTSSTGATAKDVFIARFSGVNGKVVWAMQAGGTSAATVETGHAIAVSRNATSLKVMGHFASATPINFNYPGQPAKNLTATTAANFFYARYTQASIPLSLDLESFTGKAGKGAFNQLEWVSNNEKDMHGFRLEKSDDGSNFDEIAFIPARGNKSNHRSNYSHTDQDLKMPVHYYRLRMEDIDGRFRYSNIVKIGNSKQPESQVHLYPNPANGTLQVAGLQGTASYYITDASGKILLQKNNIAVDRQHLGIDISGLPEGVFFLHYKDNNSAATLRFVKQR